MNTFDTTAPEVATDATAETGAFDTSPATPATTAETSDANPHADQPNVDPGAARAAVLKEALKLGNNKAKGDDSLPFLGRLVFDSVLDGSIAYVAPTPGKKGANVVKNDLDLMWEAYLKGASNVKHEGDSPASQKSKLMAIAKWAAGADVWEQADVLQTALDYRSAIVAQNAKLKGNKGKVKVHGVFQTMINLAYRQTDEANKDASIAREVIEACVLKDAATPPSMEDQVAAFAKKAKVWYVGDDNNPPVRTDEKMARLIAALDALTSAFAIDEQAAKDAAVLADLKARGVI